MPLVRYVAGSMAQRAAVSPIVDYDDLVGYGTEGLLHAITTFNPAAGVKFSTWAVMHIRTTIQDALRELDPLPRSVRTRAKDITRVSSDLANRQGAWPSAEQVAAELDLPVEQVRTTLHDLSRTTVSLDYVDDSGEDSSASWMASLADEDQETDPAAALDASQTTIMLREAVDQLPEREARIIRGYYREGRNMRDIAKELGVSESRISQLHSQALRRLRALLTDAVDDTVRVA